MRMKNVVLYVFHSHHFKCKESIVACLNFLLLSIPLVVYHSDSPNTELQSIFIGMACCGSLLLLNKVALNMRFVLCLICISIWIVFRSEFLLDGLLAFICLYCVAINAALHQKILFYQVIVVLIATSLFQALIAITQYFGIIHVFADYHLTVPFDPLFITGQAIGNFRQRNQLATFLSIGLISLAFLKYKSYPAFKFSNAAYYLIAIIFIFAIAATGSRTGAIQIVILLLLAWFLSKDASLKIWSSTLFFIYLLSTWVLLRSGLNEGSLWLRSALQDGCESRLILWGNVLELIQQNPLMGWGWRGLMSAHYENQFDNKFCALINNAHNFFLQIAVELGIPFALLLSASILYFCIRKINYKIFNTEKIFASLMLLMIGLHSMVEFPLWYFSFQLIAAYAVGFIIFDNDHKAANVSRYRVVTAFAIIFIALYALFDYGRVAKLFKLNNPITSAQEQQLIAEASNSVLFSRQLAYYMALSTPLTNNSAKIIYGLTTDLRSYHPDYDLMKRHIEATYLLAIKNPDYMAEARRNLETYRLNFPIKYEHWVATFSEKQRNDLLLSRAK